MLLLPERLKLGRTLDRRALLVLPLVFLLGSGTFRRSGEFRRALGGRVVLLVDQKHRLLGKFDALLMVAIRVPNLRTLRSIRSIQIKLLYI